MWGLKSAASWKPQEPDAKTIRKRALHDRRGSVLTEGCTYHGDGSITKWLLRHAIFGRTDQFELVANGKVILTGSRRKIPNRFLP